MGCCFSTLLHKSFLFLKRLKLTMFCRDKSQRVTFEGKRHGVVIVVSFCCPALSQSTLTSMPFSMRFSTRCRADIDVPLPLSWKISITIATFIFISSLSYSLLRQSFYGNTLTYASYVYYNTNKKNRKDFSIVSPAVKQLKQRLITHKAPSLCIIPRNYRK